MRPRETTAVTIRTVRWTCAAVPSSTSRSRHSCRPGASRACARPAAISMRSAAKSRARTRGCDLRSMSMTPKPCARAPMRTTAASGKAATTKNTRHAAKIFCNGLGGSVAGPTKGGAAGTARHRPIKHDDCREQAPEHRRAPACQSRIGLRQPGAGHAAQNAEIAGQFPEGLLPKRRAREARFALQQGLGEPRPQPRGDRRLRLLVLDDQQIGAFDERIEIVEGLLPFDRVRWRHLALPARAFAAGAGPS